MNQNQINIENTQLIISVKKAPVFIQVILAMILFVLALIPLFVAFYVLTYGDGPHIGIVFSFILCWGVGFYLLRVTLWNSVGREILTLSPSSISYTADYGLFKDGRVEIETKDLEAEIIYNNEPNKPFGRLRLKNKSTAIETVVLANIAELEEIKHEIKMRYKN